MVQNIFTESFETDGNGTRYVTLIPEFTDGDSDFFIRTDGSIISSSYQVSNPEGNFFFAAQDIDGEGADSQQTLSFSNINIAGFSNLSFSALLAEDEANDGRDDWDRADFVLFEYQIDSGGFNNLLAFRNNGNTFNAAPRQDTNFDEIGDGAEVTSTFQPFSSAIAGSGSLLDLRITFDLNAGDEDIAVDNIQLFGEQAIAAPEFAIVPIDADQPEGNVGTTDFIFEITRSGEIATASAVNFAVASDAGTADAADFGGTLPSGTVAFATGERSQRITIDVTGDTDIEPDESFSVVLSAPIGATIATATATGIIRNDDVEVVPPPELSISATDADKLEGDAGSTDFIFEVVRTGDSTIAIAADYSVSGLGGIDADDFVGPLPTGTVNFAAGQTAQTIVIPVAGDTDVEADESFFVELSNPVGAAIATGSATGIIRNDDKDRTTAPMVIDRPANVYVDESGIIVGGENARQPYAGILFSVTDGTLNPDDAIAGTDGDDNIWAGAEGADRIDSGDGDDIVGFGNGGSKVIAGPGNDFVYAVGTGNGANEIDLGAGDDGFWALDGDNVVTAESGNNTIGIGTGNDSVTTGDGDDFVYSVSGGGGINTLSLGNGNNKVWVENGDYVITTGVGADTIGLGTGQDSVDAGDGDNIIYAIDAATAGDKDILTGMGNDYIQTGAGNDVLNGGAGFNTLIGGEGADVFVASASAYSYIGDFQVGIDVIQLDGFSLNDEIAIAQGTGDTATDAFLSLDGNIILQVAGVTVDELDNPTNFV